MAAALPAPQSPRLKSPDELKWVGQRLTRKDTPAKCDGSAQFGIDVRVPGMVYAALRRPTVVDGRVTAFDRASIESRPGFVDAFAVTDGVAVLARSTWQAFKAAEALEITVDASRSTGVDTESMRQRMRAALDDDASARPGRPIFSKVPYDRAATDKAIASAPIRREWIYEVPYLAHAALEPLTATAVVREGDCELWAPTQQPDRTLDVMAQVSGLPREKCRLHVTLIGGGFGRKWEVDFARQAMEIARGAKGRTIHLTWTREQDFLHDRFRPAHIVRTRVGLGRDGTILGMHSRTTGINMWKYQGRAPMGNGGDPFALGLLINDKYAIGNPYADHVETQFPVPVGTWRSVSASMNGFFGESALDDIAAVTRQDPLEMRLKLLASDPRAVAVLRHAAEKAGWSQKLPRGRGRGIALSVGFNSYCAEVVEVSVRGRAVKVERIVCAFDCGRMIDPGIVEAQVEGGIVWGLCAARNGQIRFADGAATDTNFHQSPLLRMNEMPPIEIHLLRTDNRAGGAGEASVPPVAPALAQAIFAATGRRPRRLPIIESGFELA